MEGDPDEGGLPRFTVAGVSRIGGWGVIPGRREVGSMEKDHPMMGQEGLTRGWSLIRLRSLTHCSFLWFWRGFVSLPSILSFLQFPVLVGLLRPGGR